MYLTELLRVLMEVRPRDVIKAFPQTFAQTVRNNGENSDSDWPALRLRFETRTSPIQIQRLKEHLPNTNAES
jgi:hypothetical protein